MGQNPMQSAGCYGICAAILRNPNCVIRELDFSVCIVGNYLLITCVGVVDLVVLLVAFPHPLAERQGQCLS